MTRFLTDINGETIHFENGDDAYQAITELDTDYKECFPDSYVIVIDDYYVVVLEGY